MKKRRRKVNIKYLSILCMIILLIADCGIVVSAKTESVDKRDVEGIDFTGVATPANPVHYCTGENDGSDCTDWSYVYFGSYPQSEVTGSALTFAITGANYDANGDAWVNGTKYRRISKSDTNNSRYFGDSAYRYFKWEQIKWKVLKNNGSTLFVVADRGLDCKDYHDQGNDVTWENSTIRGWLNDDFYQKAFSDNEQNAIVQQDVINEDNPWTGADGGNNTTDKVYLLSIEEVGNSEYGFCENYSRYSASRRVKASDFAHAMGAWVTNDDKSVENCGWWLRSPSPAGGAAWVFPGGFAHYSGSDCDRNDTVCIPALHISLSSDLWSMIDNGSGGTIPSRPIVSVPVSQDVKFGTSATFSVTVNGGNPSTCTYQWYYATYQTGMGTRINGATSESYTIAAANMMPGLNGRYYYCVVSDGIYEIISDRAKLTVYSAPNITSPSSKIVKSGTSATFSVSANWGNPDSYTYQWYYATSQIGTGIRIDGTASASYTIPFNEMTSSLNGRYYYCVVSNGQYDVESDRAKLTVTNSEQNKPIDTPTDPVHYCTEENDGSDYTDWSYVYFGSYPQSEVAGSALTSAITGANYDANGDAWVNGIKYRRISKSDTNYNGYFGDSTYRYFKWERIKWKVLKNNGSTLFVVADKGLDCKDYHDPGSSVTWENSTIRSWLNDDFYQTAFSSNEQNVIIRQNIVNKDNPVYGTEGGNDTQDNVYLLSITETVNPEYGFCGSNSTNSESRWMQTSDYAHAMGVHIDTGSSTGGNANCWWWLRSPGNDTNTAVDVSSTGSVFRYGLGTTVDCSDAACVPALHINLFSDLWLQTDDETSGAGGIIPMIPTISSPSSQSVKIGTSAAFSVSTSGGNPNVYTYQWYYAESETGTGARISGATSANYTISADRMTTALNGRYYYCVVSNGIYEVTSGRARLTVQSNGSSTETHTPPTVSGLLEWYTAEAGTSLELTVTASGGNPSNYTYQWYYAASEFETGTKINGAVSSKYVIPASEMTLSINNRYYYCIVSNGIYNVESRRTRIFVYNETNPGSGTGGNGASLSAQIIYASSYTKEYGSKAFFIAASTNGNGKLTYQSSNKKVAEVSSNGQVKIKGYGTAIVTIRASRTQKYKAASKQITIEVIPKKIKLKKVSSPVSRRISINWKKGKKIKGYELYISSSKYFKSNTFRRVFGKSKTNTVLTGLKSGKKYYVKIRSYAKVGKKKYYSEWSKTKNVKIK